MPSELRVLTLLASVAALFGACTADDVVVATERPSGAAGTAGAGGVSGCADNDACAPNELCEKTTCGDATGTCIPRPVGCGAERAPRCGCDGVNYWNDCLCRQNGVASSTPDECSQPALCDVDADCQAPEAECGRVYFVPPMAKCPPPGPGTCWVLPSSCPVEPGDHWGPCAQLGPGPGGAPMGPCLALCDAIRNGQPFRNLPKMTPGCP